MNVPERVWRQWTKHPAPTIEVDPRLLQHMVDLHHNRSIVVDDPLPLLDFAERVGDSVVVLFMYEFWLKKQYVLDHVPEAFVEQAKRDPEEYKGYIMMYMEQGKDFKGLWIPCIFEEGFVNGWDMWLLVAKDDLKWCLDHGLTWLRTASIRALECKAFEVVPDHAFEQSQSEFWLKMFMKALEAKDGLKSSWIFQKCVKNDINKQYFYTTTCVSSPSTLEFETLPLPSTTMDHSSMQNFVTLHHLRNQPSMHTSPSISVTNTMPS